jgi:glycosyltransferase family protein
MDRVYIWGVGNFVDSVFKSIKLAECEFLGFIDRDTSKHGAYWKERYRIYSTGEIEEFDYIIISVKKSNSIIKSCHELGIPDNKIIDFWNGEVDYPFIDVNYRKVLFLEEELDKYKHRLENLPYELGIGEIPIVNSSEDLLNQIIERKCSLCRYGDGEFEMMRGRKRLWYQLPNHKLAERLKEIIHSKNDNVLIAIADNFGNLDKYTTVAADAIREYLYNGTRKAIMEILEPERVYWNAYVSRPYLMYKDKSHAKVIFDLLKKIWLNRNVLIVEGRYSRMGVRNDLFSNCKRLQRIICPCSESFDKYDEILNEIKRHAMDDTLVIISLGPTATVLAYDLASAGIQALDIGQIDNEYEWYHMGVDIQTEIEGKSVAELGGCHEPDEIYDKWYDEQIVARIS